MSKSRTRVLTLCAVTIVSANGLLVTHWMRTRNDTLFLSGRIEKDDWVLQQGMLDIVAFVAMTAIAVSILWLILHWFTGRRE